MPASLGLSQRFVQGSDLQGDLEFKARYACPWSTRKGIPLHLAMHSAVPDSVEFVAMAYASVDVDEQELFKQRAVGEGFANFYSSCRWYYSISVLIGRAGYRGFGA